MSKLEVTQARCDKLKYTISVERRWDMSGQMPYCYYCAYSQNGVCQKAQCERENEYLCARAYERERYEARKRRREGKKRPNENEDRAIIKNGKYIGELFIAPTRRDNAEEKENTKVDVMSHLKPPKEYKCSPLECDCSEYLSQYGKLTNEGTDSHYVCPNCGSIKNINNQPIDYEKIKAKELNQ